MRKSHSYTCSLILNCRRHNIFDLFLEKRKKTKTSFYNHYVLGIEVLLPRSHHNLICPSKYDKQVLKLSFSYLSEMGQRIEKQIKLHLRTV